MDTTELTRPLAGGTDANAAASPRGASTGGAPVSPAPPEMLAHVLAARPRSGVGELTRERLAPLAQPRGVVPALRSCTDELARLPGLVEVVCAASQAQLKDPSRRRGDGIDVLCDDLSERIDRIALVLEEVWDELEP